MKTGLPSFPAILVITILMITNASATMTPPNGARALSQTLLGSSKGINFGRKVELSHDGERLAVGQDETVTIYERTKIKSNIEDITTDKAWKRIQVIPATTDKPVTHRISLSPDGKAVAIRHKENVKVHVVDTGELMGAPVNVCGPYNIWNRNVKLHQTPPHSAFGQYTMLTVSCEGSNALAGVVKILRFNENDNQWDNLFTITPQETRGLFGWETAMNIHSDDCILIAIASPLFDNWRGMVQVFKLTPDGQVTLHGDTLQGENRGDKFGTAMAFNTDEQPHLVVGAPEYAKGHGCVSVFHFDRPSVSEEKTWLAIGDSPMTGTQQGDKFGSLVAISANGDRILGASAAKEGGVRSYLRTSFRTLELLGTFSDDEAGTSSIALSYSGSIAAFGTIKGWDSSGAVVGRTQVFLDGNPFCGVEMLGVSMDDQFLSRTLCRNGPSVITTPDACINHNSVFHCTWVDNLSTAPPSSAPSALPTSTPSMSPSGVPSGIPSTSPAANPSAAPSLTPSLSPSQVPTGKPSIAPSVEPTVPPSISPSAFPSMTPSVQPSLAPTAVPSASPSFLDDSIFGEGSEWDLPIVSGMACASIMAVTVGAGVYLKVWTRGEDESSGDSEIEPQNDTDVGLDLEAAIPTGVDGPLFDVYLDP
ncbi:Pectinesterase [Seminavis robusta]|uniref:Circumsporozoite protein n=1 Tax=Seminavis robusta TaxID=568900 RepID=A0A9N8H7K3_9STRA|nr:Pectinesterase [Seminavis robusta]|eukprot:Sro70_g038870.1 Pectinesterase (647) ;mRNA; f:52738-54678